jgi:hypothetical protein
VAAVFGGRKCVDLGGKGGCTSFDYNDELWLLGVRLQGGLLLGLLLLPCC